MAASRQEARSRPAPRLYLITQPVDDPAAFAPALAAALDAADIAAVLLRLAQTDERTLTKRVKTLAAVVQDRGTALVLDGHAEIIARAHADGAHLTGIDALTAALPVLKPDRIAGVGGLLTRHNAMLAGETGADYVMFGEPDDQGERPALEAVIERVSWWSEVFEIPCVGFAADLDEVEVLAAAGADFVALGSFAWTDPRGPAAVVAAAAQRLRLTELAG